MNLTEMTTEEEALLGVHREAAHAEALADFMAAHREQVWFATNGEILDYVQAFHRLEYAVDGSTVFNPSALDVTVRTSPFAVETIPAGRCVRIAPTPL